MARYEITPESVVEIHGRSSTGHRVGGDTNSATGGGEVEVQDGRIALDSSPSGYVELRVENLKSGSRLKDMALRQNVQAKQFPTIRYELKEATGGPDRFKLTGAVTFHGVTQDVIEEITARAEGDKLYIDGEHTFDIRDFGVKPFKIGPLQVYEDVKVVAHLVLRRTS